MKRLISATLAVVVSLGMTAFMTVTPNTAQAETIKVGAILAVTGGASFLGDPEAKTLEMLVDQVNAKGGINGNMIELIIMDSGGSPEKAVSFAKQLIEEEKVFAILGPSTSGETMQIKDIAEQGKTILLSCASTKAIVDPVAQYVFKTPQNDNLAVEMIYLQMNKMGISKIAVVVGGTGFGKMGAKFLNEMAPDFGITVLENEVYDPKATDLSAMVAKIKANKDVQAVVNWSIVPAQSIVAKNMRQAGWDVPLFQSHGFGNIKYAEAAGIAAEGIIFPLGRMFVAEELPDGHPQKDLLINYKKDYEARYNEPLQNTFGGHAWDAFMILVKAIEEAGPDKEKVRAAIENTKNFAGTGGVFNFSAEDHNGLQLDAFTMMTVKDGKFVLYK